MSEAHTELQMFLVWPWAKKKKKIDRYIRKNFFVLDEVTPDAINLYGFYGMKGNPKLVVGARAYVVRVMADRAARHTSTGHRFVNPHMFDAKTKLRKWGGKVGKLNSVHGSDTQEEALQNLNHVAPHFRSFRALYSAIPGQWVVLRNFKGEPDHSDIDILVQNVDRVAIALGAVRLDAYVRPGGEGVKNKYLVMVDGQPALLDLRYVGDNYFDEKWQKRILHRRKKEGDLYRPSDEDWYWTLLYHTLLHKGDVEKYREALDRLRPENVPHSRKLLADYMHQNGYRVTQPDDPVLVMYGAVVGEVVDGFGAASTEAQEGLAEKWEKACGYIPYPGTLNIKYSSTFVWPKPKVVDQITVLNTLNDHAEAVPLYFWDALLNGEPVVATSGGNRENEIEVLAPYSLRDRLDLETGDEVRLMVI